MKQWLRALGLLVPPVGRFVERYRAAMARLELLNAEYERAAAERRNLLDQLMGQTGDVNAQLADLSTDFRARTADLSSDLLARTGDLSVDLRALTGDLKADLHGLTGDLKADLHALVKDVKTEIAAKDSDLRIQILEWMMDFNKQMSTLQELWYRDLLTATTHPGRLPPQPEYILTTQFPIAVSSDDHLFPWGAAVDNTRWPRFVKSCERILNRKPLRAMDLGCSGGGIVFDFLLAGHSAIGIEGSDFSLLNQRANWRTVPFNLFTADITKPFSVSLPGSREIVPFDIVTAWDVMEHIEESDLEILFANVSRHLKEDGYFLGTIAMAPDTDPETGAVYHRTVKPKPWWVKRFADAGLEIIESPQFAFEDFPRGIGNPYNRADANYRKLPEAGFHFVAIRRKTG